VLVPVCECSHLIVDHRIGSEIGQWYECKTCPCTVYRKSRLMEEREDER
jgi:hypothetical protein